MIHSVFVGRSASPQTRQLPSDTGPQLSLGLLALSVCEKSDRNVFLDE